MPYLIRFIDFFVCNGLLIFSWQCCYLVPAVIFQRFSVTHWISLNTRWFCNASRFSVNVRQFYNASRFSVYSWLIPLNRIGFLLKQRLIFLKRNGFLWNSDKFHYCLSFIFHTLAFYLLMTVFILQCHLMINGFLSMLWLIL